MRPSALLALNASPTIDLAVTNPATGKAIIYVGEVASLALDLSNHTGAAIGLATGASTLEVLMPTYFDPSEVALMTIRHPDWKLAYQPATAALLLTYTGPTVSWAAGAGLGFVVENVQCAAAPTVGEVQVTPDQMSGQNIPPFMEQPLSLSKPPVPGNLPLLETLHVSVENQGQVYVSGTAEDALVNSFFLTLKNTGPHPLYNGATMWKTPPKVTATFVYGSTSGALASDNDRRVTAIGSAWNIVGAVQVSETNDWQAQGSSRTGQDPHPRGQLLPTNTNQGVIGTGEAANITFAFNNVISLTPPGHTQLVLQFTKFARNETTRYDDAVVVLDIVKLPPLPTRGITSLYSTNGVIFDLSYPAKSLTISLRWRTLYVDYVRLITSFPGLAYKDIPCPAGTALSYTTYDLELPGVVNSQPVFITLQAFNSQDAYLNSMQFTVFLNSQVFIDPRDNQHYPTVLVGNQRWLAQNLDYEADGSRYYNNDPANTATYGRLYPGPVAQKDLPTGWRLPNRADWQSLLKYYGSDAYAKLMAGGGSHFNAQLGGYYQPDGSSQFSDMGANGYYWTNDLSSDDAQLYAQFISGRKIIYLDGSFPPHMGCSIRYVQDL